MEDKKMDSGFTNHELCNPDDNVLNLSFGNRSSKQFEQGVVTGLTYTKNEDRVDGVEYSQEEVAVKRPVVGFFELFRFADRLDVLYMVIGTIAAMGHGFLYPTNILIYGTVLDLFIDDEVAKEMNITRNGTRLYDDMKVKSVQFCMVAVAALILANFQIALWMMAAERQAQRIRFLFLQKVMNQSIGWFDTHQTADISSKLAEDVERIQNGMGDKLATFIQWSATFVGGYTLGFVQGWNLALVIVSLTPLMVLNFIILAKNIQKYTALQLTAYSKAGAIAEEVLSAIRTVAAFGGEKKESARYNQNLEGAKNLGIKKSLFLGMGVGGSWLVVFSSFALAMWYGTKLVREEEGFTGGHVLQVFMGVLFGSTALSQAAPTMDQIAGARGAAASIFEIIDTESEIDPSCGEGKKPKSVEGNLEFKDVSFFYPSRPDVQVLKDFNISARVGQTVALVGSSGCGKSTTVQLMQRFYDPVSGSVMLDGIDLRDLNIKWLRQQVGVVSQEPILFATTIQENIRYGQDGVSDKDIERAAREANAHDFIMRLPQHYNTLVGERGAQLSGGQKQRIAIARALVRNPKILLLDEATSALDMESESIVQDALDKARQGRTTLVIAHRLSTIKNADLIIGVDKGQVVEMGTHEKLMETGGIYCTLATNQMHQTEREKKDFELSLELMDDPLMKDGHVTSFDRHDSIYHSIKSGSTSYHSIKSGSPRHNPSLKSKSFKSRIYEKEEEEAQLKDLPAISIGRIARINSPEAAYIIMATISAVFVGAIQPAFGTVFSEILGNFANTDDESQANTTLMFVFIILGIGVVASVANTTLNYFFALSGETLTMRLRQLTFNAMLRQDIGWFDDKRNQVGALTTRLASDAANVQGATGAQIGVIVQSLSTLLCGLIISFVFGWRLALVVSAFLPFSIGGGFVQARIYGGRTKDDQKILEEAGKVSSEAVDNIRTVQSLSKQEVFEKKYGEFMSTLYKRSKRKIFTFAFFFGLTQSAIFFCYAAAFGYGSYLVDQELMEYKHVFKVFMAMLFTGLAIGRAGSLGPDFSKAKISATKIFMMIDRVPGIDSSSPEGAKPANCRGEVDFSGVKFSYPSRPGVQVLQGLDLQVKPGQTLALVGTSGCGKSTTVQLIERFYDTAMGVVKLDANNVTQLNVSWLRNQLGIVGQEPVLFDASIEDNIAYGDNSRQVPMNEIIEAARRANIHNFIESLPMGYKTSTGDKGAQLSGGQKQRVAIARALIRNPKVLLLDEATSALDTESEKVVQDALDRAKEGRTCIVIAHRLSTIINADLIAVIHNGTVAEQGTHSELMIRKGFYYRLQQAQNRAQREV